MQIMRRAAHRRNGAAKEAPATKATDGVFVVWVFCRWGFCLLLLTVAL